MVNVPQTSPVASSDLWARLVNLPLRMWHHRLQLAPGGSWRVSAVFLLAGLFWIGIEDCLCVAAFLNPETLSPSLVASDWPESETSARFITSHLSSTKNWWFLLWLQLDSLDFYVTNSLFRSTVCVVVETFSFLLFILLLLLLICSPANSISRHMWSPCSYHLPPSVIPRISNSRMGGGAFSYQAPLLWNHRVA